MGVCVYTCACVRVWGGGRGVGASHACKLCSPSPPHPDNHEPPPHPTPHPPQPPPTHPPLHPPYQASLPPYFKAKTLSEWEAWALAAQQQRWSLVTICPSWVLGPPIAANKHSGWWRTCQRGWLGCGGRGGGGGATCPTRRTLPAHTPLCVCRGGEDDAGVAGWEHVPVCGPSG